MLEIRNICSYRVSVMTGDSGGSNRPNVINLGPGEHQLMMQDELTAWTKSSKQSLAKYVEMSTLRVKELTSVHVGQDMASDPAFTVINLDLDSTINTAISFRDAWNLHLKSGVHITEDLTNNMVLADPTDLVTLIAFLTAQRAFYIAHIPSVVFHSVADAVNTLTAVIPIDLATCNVLLVDLFAKFEKHKKQAVDALTAPLTPVAILTY